MMEKMKGNFLAESEIKYKSLYLFCFFALCFFIVETASATVAGTGNFELFGLPENAAIHDYGYGTSYTDPVTGDQVTVEKYFGRISEWDTTTNPNTHISGIAYGLDENNDGAGNYHDSSVTGHFDRTTGGEEFTFSAISPDPANVLAKTEVGLIGRTYFVGDITEINFGYNYSFSGSKDNDEDLLGFLIQMEISYWESGKGTSDIYSDYGTSRMSDMNNPNAFYRTNWANHFDVETGTYSGSILFNFDATDFIDGFNTDREWRINWDFVGIGKDTVGSSQQAPVPEPATMLLFGLGLLGLAGVNRRKK